MVDFVRKKLKPGKNIIEFNNIILDNTINQSVKISLNLSNSKDSANHISFFDNKLNKLYQTNKENVTWYNEITDDLIISSTISNIQNIRIIYYSVSYSFVTISNLCIEKSLLPINLTHNLNEFELLVNKTFKTNTQKIKDLITVEMNNKSKTTEKNSNVFPLSEKTYDHNEINSMIDVLLSDRLTMGKNVELFEKEFASYVGSNYAIMVNSGSSANLLAMAVLSNFKYKNGFKKGDKVIVPTICWSTSVWPIIQMGLEPVFVDININTLNADIDKVEKLLQSDNKIKGMVVVHILGNTTNMDKLMKLKKDYNLILMEDTCESLGSTYNDKYLGTFGECGTYSFYFSHHITTIEGGMVVTDDFDTYELLKCLRAHGWSRGISGYNTNNKLDNRFCFINIGYNLRPMEIQAAMGRVQLKRLKNLNNNRIKNYERIIDLLSKSNTKLLRYFTKEPNSNPAWFALPFILNSKTCSKDIYLNYLESNNIETRPVVTGNFTKQPVFKDLNIDIDPSTFVNAEIIHNQGFFIGLPSYLLSDEKIKNLVDILLAV